MTPEERKQARKNKLLQRATKNDDQIHEAMLVGNVKSLEEPVEKKDSVTEEHTHHHQECCEGHGQQDVTSEGQTKEQRESFGADDTDENTNMTGQGKSTSETNPDLFEQYRKMQKAEKKYVLRILPRKNMFSSSQ